VSGDGYTKFFVVVDTVNECYMATGSLINIMPLVGQWGYTKRLLMEVQHQVNGARFASGE
jgi:hypothetical protein